MIQDQVSNDESCRSRLSKSGADEDSTQGRNIHLVEILELDNALPNELDTINQTLVQICLVVIHHLDAESSDIWRVIHWQRISNDQDVRYFLYKLSLLSNTVSTIIP